MCVPTSKCTMRISIPAVTQGGVPGTDSRSYGSTSVACAGDGSRGGGVKEGLGSLGAEAGGGAADSSVKERFRGTLAVAPCPLC